jgi:putative flippase GtrA
VGFVEESRYAGDAETSVLPAAPPSPPARTTRWSTALLRGRTRELATFALIGAGSTVLQLGLFDVLRWSSCTAQVANAVSLLTATVVNTAANRRLTFGVSGRDGAMRHQLQGLIVFALTLGLTSGALLLLHGVSSNPARWVETLVVAVATAVATLVKYVAMRRWMFASPSDAA